MNMAQLQAMQQMMSLQMNTGAPGGGAVDPAQLQQFLQLQGNQGDASQLFQGDSSSSRPNTGV